MHFSIRDQFYQASHITGPKHNFLALALNLPGTLTDPQIESLPPLGPCRPTPLNQRRILAAIMEGVQRANTRFGTRYSIRRAHYLANDTGPEHLYGFIALKLLEHLVSGGTFAPTDFPLVPEHREPRTPGGALHEPR